MKKRLFLFLVILLFGSPVWVLAEDESTFLEQELNNISDEFVVDNLETASTFLEEILQEQYLNSDFEVFQVECQNTSCTVSLALKDNLEMIASKTVYIKVAEEEESSVVSHNDIKVEESDTNNTNTYEEATPNALSYGWVIEGDNTYYYQDGEKVTGFQDIEGETYYFGSDGSMYKGVLDLGGKKYLLGEKSGKLYRSGFATTNSNGKTYYSDENGVLLLGFQEIEGETYYFVSDGSMYKGVLDLGGKKYLLGEKSGKLYRSGFATTNSNGKTYYSDENGVLLLGFQEIEGETYYFGSDGSMYKGIMEIEGKRYLFGFNSGKLYIGWAKVPNGDMYYTDASGVVQTGYQTIEGKDYLFDEAGILQTGWQEIEGKTYYFYADGSRATYISKIAGVRYEFSATGELQYSNVKLIIDVSAWQGDIDWDTLWNSGEIDGVILRIAAGCEQEDVMLATYIKNIKRLGIPYGIYIYSYAENYDEGVLYANFTQDVIHKYDLNPTLGIYLDLESNVITSYMGVLEYENVVRGFMSVLPNAKVYTYTYYANTALNSDYIRPYITWIANYDVTDRPGDYQGWQYTSSASVPGIQGNVDMSIFYS